MIFITVSSIKAFQSFFGNLCENIFAKIYFSADSKLVPSRLLGHGEELSNYSLEHRRRAIENPVSGTVSVHKKQVQVSSYALLYVVSEK